MNESIYLDAYSNKDIIYVWGEDLSNQAMCSNNLPQLSQYSLANFECKKKLSKYAIGKAKDQLLHIVSLHFFMKILWNISYRIHISLFLAINGNDCLLSNYG